MPDTLIGDSDRLRQIILNLAGNSVKFTESGRVALDVALGTTAGPEQRRTCDLVFRIEDTGAGIPEDKQSQVFEAFNQTDSPASRGPRRCWSRAS